MTEKSRVVKKPKAGRTTRRYDGIRAKDLDQRDLERELKHMYETREQTFFNGSRDAFETHTERMLELEREYARRFPREVEAEPLRTREGRRRLTGQRAKAGARPAGKGSPVGTGAGETRGRKTGARSARGVGWTQGTSERARSSAAKRTSGTSGGKDATERAAAREPRQRLARDRVAPKTARTAKGQGKSIRSRRSA